MNKLIIIGASGHGKVVLILLHIMDTQKLLF